MAIDDELLGKTLAGPPPGVQEPGILDQAHAFISDPRAASALLSFGLQAMQPVAIGQTGGGHLAQAIGAAGEGYTRRELMDQKEAIANNKLAVADERLELARRAQDLRERKGVGRKIGGLTDLMKARFTRQDQAAYERRLDSDAKEIAKQVANLAIIPDDNSPYAQYKGLRVDQIRDRLRKERPMGAGGTAPTADDEEEDDPVVAPAAAAPAPRSAGRQSVPPQSVEFLKKNPQTRDQFDLRYGAGAAAAILGR